LRFGVSGVKKKGIAPGGGGELRKNETKSREPPERNAPDREKEFAKTKKMPLWKRIITAEKKRP